MKKLTALLLALSMLFVLSACGGSDDGKNDNNGELYYDYKMEDYLTLSDFSKEVDKNSETYKLYYEDFYYDVFGDKLAKELNTGTVEDGDVANIDYQGLKDGIAFEGGTATGYDLTIGSGSFIDGFEEGLIGAEIGSQVELNLTFPEGYQSAELAGKAVVFKVTINKVSRYMEPTDKNVKDFGFKSLEDYNEQAEQYALGSCVFEKAFTATKINEYPQKERKILVQSMVKYFEDSYGQKAEELASGSGMTVEQFEDYIFENYVSNYMKFDVLSHYILQTRNIKFDESDVEATREKLTNIYGEKLEESGYNQLEIERKAVYDKALFTLAKEATVK